MGSAAYRRGSELIRKQIDQDSKQWDGYTTHLENKLSMLENNLLSKDAEIKALKNDLDKAKRYLRLARTERDILKDELHSAHKSVEYFKDLWKKARESEKWLEEKCLILSQVIRRAVNPELYKEIRQEIKDEFDI